MSAAEWWKKPGTVRITNGPIRTITEPKATHRTIGQDAQVIEFLLPLPTFILDPQPWDPLRCSFGDTLVFVQKPFTSMKPCEPDGRLGNESVDAFCTVLRMATPFEPTKNYPKPADLWPLVTSLLSWMRVKARHYWIMHGQDGFGFSYRGSVLDQRGTRVGLQNFMTYGRSVIVRPLSREIWSSLEFEVSEKCDVPAAESLFCDALVSAITGEALKAALELGVAAEVGLTRLLADAANQAPTNPAKRKFIANGEWDKFTDKLDHWPGRLGMQSPKSFKAENISKHWIDEVKELYRYRGSVAHSGRTQMKKNIAVYIHATNALLGYCREQREQTSLPIYTYPAGISAFQQIEAVTDAVLSSESPMVFADLGQGRS